MALAYTAPTWTDGSGEGISASNLQAISNCIEGLVQGTDKAIHNIAMANSIITLTFSDGTQETVTAIGLKGIVSIEKTATAGTVDTYTITYTDGTTSTFTVTNGTGTGDMSASDYDPNGDVKEAGGIPDYVEGKLPTVLEQTTYSDSGETRTFSFSDEAITTTSRFDYYANVFGVMPTSVSLSSGSLNVMFKTSDGVTECAVEIK